MKSKFLLLIFLLPLLAFAQTQIGDDINGEAAGDLSGISLSLSADGSIVAIGAPDNDGNGGSSGHVRVYQYMGGTWTQIGSDIDGEAQDDISGYYVSLSADGNILAIGAPWNDGNGVDSGHVRVYQNIGGTWTQIGDDIDGEAAFDNSGESVSLSADGTIVAIGAIENDGNGFESGHVRVYENIGGTWTQIGADIDGEAEGDLFGVSVDLSSDGSIVAIGGWLNDGNGIDSGHVRVFENMGGTWTQLGADIDGEAADDRAAYISLSADGNTVAIGAPLNDGVNGADSGHVRIYHYSGGNWSQIGEDIDGAGDDNRCGLRTAISDDGSIVAVTGPFYEGSSGFQSGHIRIFKNVGGAWIQRGTDIEGVEEGDRFPFDVSLSADGSIVTGSARPNDDNGTNSGQVRVFDLSSVLGIDDNSLLNFSVYPSPTIGILNINSETTITQIEIYNLLGQLVKSFTDQNTINISSVDQGVYFVKVMDENGNVGSQKVVKK
jgi:Flp pilus assembly pilin Flp